MTIDFWCVSAKAGLLSRTSTPLSASALRVSSLSAEPSRRCGLSITRTLTPRACAAFTAATMSGSVNRNMRMLIDALRAVERIDQRLGGVIGQDDQAVRHGGFYNAGFPVPRSRP